MIRSFLTLLLFLPSVFSLDTRSYRANKSRRKATRKLNPDDYTVYAKSAKKGPIIQEIDLINSDEFVDISQGLAPLFLVDLITCFAIHSAPCNDYSGSVIPLPVSLTGTLWMDNGDVDTSVVTDDSPDPEDYWYTLECTLLEDKLYEILYEVFFDANGWSDWTTLGLPGKSSCIVDVCLGRDNDTGDPNCVYLRYSGEMYAELETEELFTTGRLAMSIDPFKATVIGGTGYYAGSIGEAIVDFDQYFTSGFIELRTVPSDALDGLWDEWE